MVEIQDRYILLIQLFPLFISFLLFLGFHHTTGTKVFLPSHLLSSYFLWPSCAIHLAIWPAQFFVFTSSILILYRFSVFLSINRVFEILISMSCWVISSLLIVVFVSFEYMSSEITHCFNSLCCSFVVNFLVLFCRTYLGLSKVL